MTCPVGMVDGPAGRHDAGGKAFDEDTIYRAAAAFEKGVAEVR